MREENKEKFIYINAPDCEACRTKAEENDEEYESRVYWDVKEKIYICDGCRVEVILPKQRVTFFIEV